MTAMYRITKDAEFSGAIVYIDGQEPLTVPSTHENYTSILDLLLDELDEDDRLLSPAKVASDKLSILSERVTYRGGSLYFDGDLLGTGLADHIIRLIETDPDQENGDQNWSAFVNFLEKLATNPSRQSREHLFQFIESNGMTVTEDGMLLGYKGVNNDGTSSHAGYGIVDGVVYDNAHLPNQVGSVVEIPRSMVDNDRGIACSTGLHVGNYSYARSFAPKLLRVLVNPRDVVSVPEDHQNKKIRVSRYEVLEENDIEYTDPTYFAEKDDDDFAEDVPEYDQDEQVVSFGPATSAEGDDDDHFWEEDDVDPAWVDNNYPETIIGTISVTQLSQDGNRERDNTLPDNQSGEPIADVRVGLSAPIKGSEADKISAFKELITKVLQPEGKSLRGYRGKYVTAKSRPIFTEAARQLGIDLDS
jgi:hypothetical protein